MKEALLEVGAWTLALLFGPAWGAATFLGGCAAPKDFTRYPIHARPGLWIQEPEVTLQLR